jgi:hypothetical protein
MAEALVAIGVASSLITFIQFSQQIASQLRDLNVGDVPGSFQDIKMRLPLIISIINRVQSVAHRLSPEDKDTLGAVVDNCFKQVSQLDSILQRLTIGRSDSTLKKGFKAAIGLAEETRTRKIATALKDNIQLLTCLNLTPADEKKPGNAFDRRTSEAPPRYSDSTGVFSVPFIRDSHFVSRGNVMPSISDAFERRNRVAVAGIGGVG